MSEPKDLAMHFLKTTNAAILIWKPPRARKSLWNFGASSFWNWIVILGICKLYEPQISYIWLSSAIFEPFFLFQQTLHIYIYVYIINWNILRVSRSEKKTNITEYFLNIYLYILVKYFLLNIYTKWMLLMTQRVCWLIIKKQTEETTLITSLKKGFVKSFCGQNKLNRSI